MRIVFFRRNEVEIADDWHTSGMRGTGSNSFRVEGIRVPQGRWASLEEAPRETGALYRFNVWSLLALGVAAVPLGIARRALEELLALAVEKVPTGSRRTAAERAVVQRQVAEAEAAISSSRSFFFESANAAWETACRGDELSLVERARLRLAATNAAHRCAAAVDLLYHAGGGSSVYENNYLQKAFRDVHVITQHLVVAERSLELLGSAAPRARDRHPAVVGAAASSRARARRRPVERADRALESSLFARGRRASTAIHYRHPTTAAPPARPTAPRRAPGCDRRSCRA